MQVVQPYLASDRALVYTPLLMPVLMAEAQGHLRTRQQSLKPSSIRQRPAQSPSLSHRW